MIPYSTEAYKHIHYFSITHLSQRVVMLNVHWWTGGITDLSRSREACIIVSGAHPAPAAPGPRTSHQWRPSRHHFHPLQTTPYPPLLWHSSRSQSLARPSPSGLRNTRYLTAPAAQRYRDTAPRQQTGSSTTSGNTVFVSQKAYQNQLQLARVSSNLRKRINRRNIISRYLPAP